MAGATQIDPTAQGEYVGSEEERFKMEQGGQRHLRQQAGESVSGPKEANAVWSECEKSDGRWT